MAYDPVLERISAWETEGLIDHDLADRLRQAEEAASRARAPGPPPGTIREGVAHVSGGVAATELFAFLGGGFALAAWYVLVASSQLADGADRSLVLGGAALLATAVLVGVSAGIAPRGERGRRGAGAVLAVALANLGAGVFLVLDQLHAERWGDAPTNALVAWAVTLMAGVAFRSRLPALTTQAGLAVAAAGTGWVAMDWLGVSLFGAGGDGAPPLDPGAALVRVGLTVGWWWLVACGMAVLLVLLDRGPAAGARQTLGRVAVGLAAVGGTATGIAQRHPWNAAQGLADRAVLEPLVGAAVLLGVSAVLLWLAIRRVSTGYLWPAGLGIFGALTYVNAEYVVDEGGLWVALLVEAVLLFSVAFVIRAVGLRLGRPGGGASPLAPVPGA